jgi:hypothetical protein
MIYWISEDYVRDNLPVEYSLLSGNILPALQQAHFINARDILGDRLFDKINELILTNTIDDPANERFKFLLDQYLQNVVLYWTMVYMTTNLLAKYANRGIQSQQGEFSNNVDLSVWRTLKTEFSDLATYYSQRANDWLFWNQNDYVPYYTYMLTNGLQAANPRDKFRFGGVVLGARRRFSYNNMCCY